MYTGSSMRIVVSDRRCVPPKYLNKRIKRRNILYSLGQIMDNNKPQDPKYESNLRSKECYKKIGVGNWERVHTLKTLREKYLIMTNMDKK